MFKAGQAVNYLPRFAQELNSGGRFAVVRKLPDEGHGNHYRIKNAAGVERVVPEEQLEAVE